MDKLEVLLKAAGNITKEKRIDNLIEILSNLAKELIEADRCSLFLIDEERKELYSIFAHGIGEIRIPIDSGIAGYVARKGELYLTYDAYSSEFFNPDIDRLSGYRTENILAIPLFDSKEKIIGVYQFINKEGVYTEEDLKLVRLLSEFASTTIEAKILQEKIQDAYKKILIKLSKASVYKDPEPPNHFLRVGLISALIAKKLGIEEQKCDTLLLASTLHDMGKIGIPDSVLFKAGNLDPDEWDIMKKHPLIGYEILYDDDIELLKMAAVIALEHHERWDGTGYPLGKKEEEISIWARIVSIADNFDTLTSEKRFEGAWDFTRAVDYINLMSGKAFDPKLIDIFNENIDKIRQIKTNYED
ncbi:HD domain-containing phosphohydrolase [Thermodesulfovibrio sp.]|uniref:HD-GYP domain-containing protein n=1 Tax=Thermodesulfovibrio sp. TaxID=2067987 RepID=UPI0030B715F4